MFVPDYQLISLTVVRREQCRLAALVPPASIGECLVASPLAERRELKLPNGESLRTPLLVPSFSSRIADVEKPLNAGREFIDGPFLVSAFDIAKGYLTGPFDFAGTVFLDSGGYEVGPGSDLSDVSSVPSGAPEDWSPEEHSAVWPLVVRKRTNRRDQL